MLKKLSQPDFEKCIFSSKNRRQWVKIFIFICCPRAGVGKLWPKTQIWLLSSLLIKFYSNTSTPIFSLTVCGCFCTSTELNTCSINCMICKLKMFTLWLFTGKSASSWPRSNHVALCPVKAMLHLSPPSHDPQRWALSPIRCAGGRAQRGPRLKAGELGLGVTPVGLSSSLHSFVCSAKCMLSQGLSVYKRIWRKSDCLI